MKKFANSLMLLAVVLFSGCQSSDLGVIKSSKEQWLTNRIESPLTGKGMSFKVKNYLTEKALEEEYTKNPERVLKRLNRKFNKNHDKNILLALIELTYVQGQKKSGMEALSYFLSSAVYSSDFFGTAKIPDPIPFSPHFIYVCRCYNYAIAEIISLMQKEKLSLRKEHTIPILQGTMRIEPSKSFLPYPFADYKEFLVCSEYVPYGFLTSSRRYGIGVPLIAIQENRDKQMYKKIKGDIYSLFSSPSPATVFLRIKQSDLKQYHGTLEFYNPYNEDSIDFENRKVPLEIDITTPLAYMTREGAEYSGFNALANPKYMHIPEGLFLMTPYQKDKIPLVLVHGLMSRPRTWAQMINTLLNDEQIRTKYQIWLFAYPTGFPILYSSDKLRKTLLQAQQLFNPKKNTPNFDKMVIIGHSMGGLLTRSTVQNTGNELVNLIFKTPIDKMELPEDEKQMLKNMLIFKSLPFVKRMIFMSTPHRGSEMTHWASMRLAVLFINLPKTFEHKMEEIAKHVKLKEQLIKGDDQSIAGLQGVDSLDPDDVVMRFMAEQPISVKYHSIIGNEKEAEVIGGTDGIVSYSSAHLDGAESEIVIKSNHETLKRPAGIKEVHRILLKHLKESK